MRAQAPSGFLRPEPSRFFGRVDELRRIDHDAIGGITAIVGPAGIGKTRLALRFGITRGARFASVWFCDASDAASVTEMIAIVRHTLAASDRIDSPSDPIAVERAIAARAGALVIIDDVEHLLPDAAVTLARWSQAHSPTPGDLHRQRRHGVVSRSTADHEKQI